MQRQLKNITDDLNKRMKKACNSLEKNIYALDKSILNEVEKEYGRYHIYSLIAYFPGCAFFL